MELLLSHSIGPEDGPLASRLKALTSAYEVRLVLPERGPGARRPSLRGIDAVLALVTRDGEAAEAVETELAEAVRAKKPVLAIVEDGVALSASPPGVRPVRFRRDEPQAHEDALHDALAALVATRRTAAAQRAARHTALAMGAVVAIAVGLLALAVIRPKPEPEVAEG